MKKCNWLLWKKLVLLERSIKHIKKLRQFRVVILSGIKKKIQKLNRLPQKFNDCDLDGKKFDSCFEENRV